MPSFRIPFSRRSDPASSASSPSIAAALNKHDDRHEHSAARLVLLFNRVFTLTLAVGILGLTAFFASAFNTKGISTPPKLAYIIACSTITIPASFYLSLTNSPKPWLLERPPPRFVQLAVDVGLTAMWIAAAAVAKDSCEICVNVISTLALCAIMAFWFFWASIVDVAAGKHIWA